jgi:hypothetical protein
LFVIFSADLIATQPPMSTNQNANREDVAGTLHFKKNLKKLKLHSKKKLKVSKSERPFVSTRPDTKFTPFPTGAIIDMDRLFY